MARDADENTINRALRQKMYDARIGNKTEELKRLEAAKDVLLMSSLTSRLKVCAHVCLGPAGHVGEHVYGWCDGVCVCICVEGGSSAAACSRHACAGGARRRNAAHRRGSWGPNQLSNSLLNECPALMHALRPCQSPKHGGRHASYSRTRMICCRALP